MPPQQSERLLDIVDQRLGFRAHFLLLVGVIEVRRR
jgi:hypothetical protein